MIRKVRLFALISQLLIEAILIALVFLTVDKARLSEQVFWIAWSFSFVGNALIAVSLFFLTRKKAEEWLTIPPLYYVGFVISFIYLVLGMVFMYVPLTDPTWVWFSELALTALFIILTMYMALGAQYINRNTRHVKEKVAYIREAQVIAEDLANNAKEDNSKKAVKKLAEDIRYSDPMSDDSVASYEKELYDALLDAQNALEDNESADITEFIKNADRALKRRNSLVKIRK